MRFLLRISLITLILGAAAAHAQRDQLVATLTQPIDAARVLDTAREVFEARGWSVELGDVDLFAEKKGARLRVFIAEGGLYCFDGARRATGVQRNGRGGTTHLVVRQEEIDALRADLSAALTRKGAVLPVTAPAPSGKER